MCPLLLVMFTFLSVPGIYIATIGTRVHLSAASLAQRFSVRFSPRDCILLQNLDVWSGLLPQDFTAGTCLKLFPVKITDLIDTTRLNLSTTHSNYSLLGLHWRTSTWRSSS
jgi:hypothetical protein